jgi:antitoxin ParD1/3/4
MTTLNISLPEAMKEFVEAEVAAGGYSTASEYVRELLRDAQKRKEHARIEALLEEGLNSGEPTPMTQGDWDRLEKRLKMRLAARQVE